MERPDRPLRSRGNAVTFLACALRSPAWRNPYAFIGACAVAGVILLGGSGLIPEAHAGQDRYLDVRGAGDFKPIPVAVTAFAGDAAASAQATAIITNNFKRSVFLTPI